MTTTAGTQKNATATKIASNMNPYPPFTRSLVLNDPLSDNNRGHQWQIYSDSATGNSCQFVSGAYHVVATPHFHGGCFSTATESTNFTDQGRMYLCESAESFE